MGISYPESNSRATRDIPDYSRPDKLPFDAAKTEWLLSKWYAPGNQNEVFTYWGQYNSRFVNASEFANPAALSSKFKSLVMTPGAETFTISLGKAEAVWEDGAVKTIGASAEEVSTHPAVRDAGLFINGFSGSEIDYNPMIPVDTTQDMTFLRSYLSRAGDTACSAVSASLSAEAEDRCGMAVLSDVAAAQ